MHTCRCHTMPVSAMTDIAHQIRRESEDVEGGEEGREGEDGSEREGRGSTSRAGGSERPSGISQR